jgi:hypothetical protein
MPVPAAISFSKKYFFRVINTFYGYSFYEDFIEMNLTYVIVAFKIPEKVKIVY